MIVALMFLLQPADYPECDEEKAELGIQAEMNICAHRDFMVADAALNVQWQATSAKMKQFDGNGDVREWDERPGYFDTMLEAQRAWLKYRDAHCRSEGYWARGGSMEPLLVSMCKTKLTEERTQQLQFLAEQ